MDGVDRIRPLGGATFLPPTGRGDFLVAHWEGRLSCRPLRIEEDEEEGGLIVPPTPPIGDKKAAAPNLSSIG